MSLTFDEVEHKYFWNSKEVPGVSHILKTVGLTKDFSGIDPFYKERGIATHRAIELYLKGTLDEKSLDPVIVPFFQGFLKYWSTQGEKPIAIEGRGYSESHGYAGSWDLETASEIIDWKCSKSHDRVAELQGEAYKILAGGSKRFRVVQLPGDGTFKCFEYGNGVDLWPAVMKLYSWRKKK